MFSNHSLFFWHFNIYYYVVDSKLKMKLTRIPRLYRKMAKKSKYTFTLKGVNIGRVNQTYSIEIPGDEVVEEDKPSANTTRLTELNAGKGTPEVISFLDESKRLHICHVSMIDFHSRMDINLLRYHCFWCRHPFDTRPIGCPIKYVASHAEKKYHSHISRDMYTIKEDVTSKRRQELDESEQLLVNIGEYYETDGVFCSFNCCKSWINDNKHNRLYDLSLVLLMKMYNAILCTKMDVISPAPHWRTLEQYGGHLNILKFREGFNKVDYKCHGNTKKIPNFLPMGTLFEENIKF